jgi:hypothetical protein
MTVKTRVITGPHFITTSPTLITCRHCGRPILAATVEGLDRHVDPVPLTLAGELAALLAGRPTYDLAGAMRDHLIRRTVHHIRGGARQLPVVADHDCASPDPAHVDHSHLEVAAALVRHLLGGEIVTTGDADDRPPY